MPRDARRDLLLDTAARLFAERGFAATTVSDVAAAAGLTKPGLYYHVRTKIELLDAICAGSIRTVLERIETLPTRKADPVAQLNDIIALHVGYFADHPYRLAVLNREMAHLVPERREQVKQLQRRYLDRLRRVIEAGIAGGRFHCLDATVSAFLLLSMVNHLDAWYRPDGGIDYRGITAHVQRLFLHGLVDTPPADGDPP